jgi:hypothetical protein
MLKLIELTSHYRVAYRKIVTENQQRKALRHLIKLGITRWLTLVNIGAHLNHFYISRRTTLISNSLSIVIFYHLVETCINYVYMSEIKEQLNTHSSEYNRTSTQHDAIFKLLTQQTFDLNNFHENKKSINTEIDMHNKLPVHLLDTKNYSPIVKNS